MRRRRRRRQIKVCCGSFRSWGPSNWVSWAPPSASALAAVLVLASAFLVVSYISLSLSPDFMPNFHMLDSFPNQYIHTQKGACQLSLGRLDFNYIFLFIYICLLLLYIYISSWLVFILVWCKEMELQVFTFYLHQITFFQFLRNKI